MQYLEEICEGGLAVRHVLAVLALGNVDEGHDDLAEGRQGLVDLARLLKSRPARLRNEERKGEKAR